ncbi:MAG: DegQ family serine endoprotease [Proteobacteria bacterium]|nr:DegQ family serine endoprotease [Pseudomonadota bacterium]MDE3208961.1 DegQ family serine endoprotease [Pseudomonadota bacterium]
MRKALSQYVRIFLFVTLVFPAAAFAHSLPDFTSIVQKYGNAVVNISTTQTIHEQGFPNFNFPEGDPFAQLFKQLMPPEMRQPHNITERSLGSGFIISSDGYILTNAHVVDGADSIVVKLTDRRQFKGKLIGEDKRTDVALVKINAKNLPTVKIGNPATLKPGQWVVAIGAPFGFDNSVTAGIVSALGRSLPDDNYVPFIQTDVPINPGNSGGPLFNMDGEVVGINSQIYSKTGGYMGLSFAIPIDVALNVSQQLREFGKASHGRLGVGIQEVTPELAQSFGLSQARGALVSSVDPHGPAAKAGIRVSDIILAYAGHTIRDATDLPRYVGETRPGTRVNVELWRHGHKLTVSVVVGTLSSGSKSSTATHKPLKLDKLGLAVRNLTEEERHKLGIKHGVIIIGVKGAAANLGLEEGDVILAVNNTRISSAEMFDKIVNKAAPGKNIALLIMRGTTSIYVPLQIPALK